MLHIAPQRRPTAEQLVKHPWLTSAAMSSYDSQPVRSQMSDHEASGAHLKEAVAATFRAIAASPQVAHLGPVAMSSLARRRRARDKTFNGVQNTS